MPEELANINAGFLTPDLIVVVLVLAGVLAYSSTAGKDHGVTMLQALYMAALPFFFVPQVVESLPTLGAEPYLAKIIYLAILWLVTFFILLRNEFFESPMVPALWEIGVFGVLFTGMAVAIVGTFLPPEMIEGTSSVVRAAFTGDAMLTFWVLAPVGAWILIKGE